VVLDACHIFIRLIHYHITFFARRKWHMVRMKLGTNFVYNYEEKQDGNIYSNLEYIHFSGMFFPILRTY